MHVHTLMHLACLRTRSRTRNFHVAYARRHLNVKINPLHDTFAEPNGSATIRAAGLHARVHAHSRTNTRPRAAALARMHHVRLAECRMRSAPVRAYARACVRACLCARDRNFASSSISIIPGNTDTYFARLMRIQVRRRMLRTQSARGCCTKDACEKLDRFKLSHPHTLTPTGTRALRIIHEHFEVVASSVIASFPTSSRPPLPVSQPISAPNTNIVNIRTIFAWRQAPRRDSISRMYHIYPAMEWKIDCARAIELLTHTGALIFRALQFDFFLLGACVCVCVFLSSDSDLAHPLDCKLYRSRFRGGGGRRR